MSGGTRGFSKSLNPNKYEHPVYPSFSVYKSTQQADITGIEKITWETEDWDTNSDFASSTHTPTVARKYHYSCTIQWLNLGLTQTLRLYIYKNGAEVARTEMETPGSGAFGDLSQSISKAIDMNGSTDYIEIFAENTDISSADIWANSGGSIRSWFSGFAMPD